MEIVRYTTGLREQASYKRQSYDELLTACGNRITHGGRSRRGWTFTTNAEEVTCGRCKITQEWRGAMRELVHSGQIAELPRFIP